MDAEFKLISQVYAAESAAQVDNVTGAVGPLFYCTVVINGKRVQAMVDTNSSASILSYELFTAIGKKAKITVRAQYILTQDHPM